MSAGVVSGNYQATDYVETVDDGFNMWIKCYNTSTSAVTNGAATVVSFTTDSTTGYYPVLAACATNSAYVQMFGAVENSRLNQSTIAATSWGYVQVRGVCPVCTTAGATTIGHVLTITQAAPTVFTSSGATTLTSAGVGIALTSVTVAGSIRALLYGGFHVGA